MSKKIPPPDYFTFFHVDHVPAEALVGTIPDPIYPPAPSKLFEACVEFYRKADLFLSGISPFPPEIVEIISAFSPFGCFLDLEIGITDQYGPSILVRFEDLDRLEERFARSFRVFDPEYIPVLILLTAAGGSYRFNDSEKQTDDAGNKIPRDSRRLYLAFGRGTDANFSLLSVIADTEIGKIVKREENSSNILSHYDHRKSRFRIEGEGKGKSQERRRAGACKHAVLHWKRSQSSGKEMPASISANGFGELLQWAFDVADRLYSRNRG